MSSPTRSTPGLLADVVPFSSVDGPGNRFVVFTQGCNFDCLACHNPSTIARTAHPPRTASVPEVVEEIRAVEPYLSGITTSGGECTLQVDFLVELFGAVKADPQLARLTTFVDSNGNAEPAVWDRLVPVADRFMLDLKALDPVVHRRLTGHGNERVLASIRHLAARGVLHEVRLLVVPGWNDDPAGLAATGRWLAAIDPDLRTVVIGFRRHGVRPGFRDVPEPTPEDLARHRDLLLAAGLRDVVTV